MIKGRFMEKAPDGSNSTVNRVINNQPYVWLEVYPRQEVLNKLQKTIDHDWMTPITFEYSIYIVVNEKDSLWWLLEFCETPWE